MAAPSVDGYGMYQQPASYSPYIRGLIDARNLAIKHSGTREYIETLELWIFASLDDGSVVEEWLARVGRNYG